MDKKRNNLVFLMTDHQRADSIGMAQCEKEVTPCLNRLAKEGTAFLRAYDTCPLCVPARTALATGRYPTAGRVVYNDWKGGTAMETDTIHTLLKKAGYRVGHVGVDHIRVKPRLGERGLDVFINQEDYGNFAKEKGVLLKREEWEASTVWEEVDNRLTEQRYSNTRSSIWPYGDEAFKDFYFTRKACEFLEGCKKDLPFALFLYLWAPHPPLKVPKAYGSLYPPKEVTLPPNINVPARGEPNLRREGVPAQLAEEVSEEEWREVWSAHLGLVSMADDLFGQVLNKLSAMGFDEDTTVVFTSDHGDSLGQHKMYQKMEMYEECIHVPLLIKSPGIKPVAVESVVSHIDLAPTLCGLLDVSWEGGDGISLLPLMQGKKEDDRMVFSQYSGNPGLGTVRRAAVTKDYKYIWDSSGQRELYDLKNDPMEMKNVADHKRYGNILKWLHQECRRFHENHGDFVHWEE